MLNFIKNLFKTKSVKVDVEKLRINIVTRRDTYYYIEVVGIHVTKNKFKIAMTVLWEKLLSNQYILINSDKNETFYLNVDEIAEIRIKSRESYYVEAKISKRKNPLFIS